MLAPNLAAGRAIRERQLDIFEQTDHQFLERCRALAVLICRQQGQVSINDIRAYIEVPPGVHPSVLGAVFRTKQFQKVGHTEATHPQAHARVVRVYSLATNKE
jgi:hypothetical protein